MVISWWHPGIKCTRWRCTLVAGAQDGSFLARPTSRDTPVLAPGNRAPPRRYRCAPAETFGTTEEWTITNTSPLAHPFHLHVWPFTVIATSNGSPPTSTPQDVVLIPPRGWVRLRIPFTHFTGRSVYHCHILDREDAGMMATVNVRA